jgi:hypothetical protein
VLCLLFCTLGFPQEFPPLTLVGCLLSLGQSCLFLLDIRGDCLLSPTLSLHILLPLLLLGLFSYCYNGNGIHKVYVSIPLLASLSMTYKFGMLLMYELCPSLLQLDLLGSFNL